MVKHDDKWGTVSNWQFKYKESASACKTLGFSGGSARYEITTSVFSISTVPIWMESVKCASSSTSFWQCSHLGWGVREQVTYHYYDVWLTCD